MTTTYDVGKLGHGLRQVQICGEVKPIYGIPTLTSWKLDETGSVDNYTLVNIYENTKKCKLILESYVILYVFWLV